MSLFQCSKCGCLENTAFASYYGQGLLEKHPEAYESYRKVLGLRENDEYGIYCSACCPIWFKGGEYGIGPRPEGHDAKEDAFDRHAGIWHGKFRRTFLPKRMFHMNGEGNLAHIETLDIDVDKYALEAEEEIELPVKMPSLRDIRLPDPRDGGLCSRYLQKMRAIKGELAGVNEAERRQILNLQALALCRGGEVTVGRKRSRMPTMAAAALALGTMGGVYDTPRRREAPPPPEPTKEEREAAYARSDAKRLKAEAKRARKTEKRMKNASSRT